MRVLWLSHFVPFPATGLGALQRSHNLLRQIALRHQVFLIALNRPRLLGGAEALAAARDGLAPMVKGLAILPHEGDASRWSRVGCAGKALLHGSSYLEAWLLSAACAEEVDRQVKAFAPDVIHVDNLGLMQLVEARHWSRVVLNHHNVESHMMRRRAAHQGPGWRRWYFQREAGHLDRLERAVAPGVRLNLVVSPLDADRLASVAPGARVRVIENGVDTEYFQAPAAVKPEAGALAFAGGMDWYPNRQAIDWLCAEIWPALVADGSDWTLTVIGRAPSPRLLELVAADRRVHAPGFVDDLRPVLAAAPIYICPIVDGGGTRLKILDALSMERALVSTTLGVEGLGLEEGRHYLGAETPDEFVRQCRRLRDDAELATRLGRAGRAHVIEHFSWSGIGRRLESAYGEAAPAAAAELTTLAGAPGQGR
jgi:glycosyltransferase involved in cell wall biosynthesis